MLSERHRFVLHGAAGVLPGLPGTTSWFDRYAHTVLQGTCHLETVHDPSLPVQLAGIVHEDLATELSLAPKIHSRMSRASLLAHVAVQRALTDAALDPRRLDPERTVLIVTSVQFGLDTVTDLVRRVDADGPEAAGLDYWLSGTPGSIASALCCNLNISAPTLSLTGGCSTSLRAVSLGIDMLGAGQVDHAILVGTESPLDPVFLSSCTRTGRSGFRATSGSASPGDIQPHDNHQSGNAIGEGAIAVVLGRAGTEGRARWQLCAQGATVHCGSLTPAGIGRADRFAETVMSLLSREGTRPSQIAHINDFAEGGRRLEDFCVDVLQHLQVLTPNIGSVPLTSGEASFGHVPGASGMMKFLASVAMLDAACVAPTTNLTTPYARWAGWCLPQQRIPVLSDDARQGLILAASGGGDCSALLISLAAV